MTAQPLHSGKKFGEAAGLMLIGVAIKLGKSPSARKRNLATLYEAGAISGDVFAWALARHQLEAA